MPLVAEKRVCLHGHEISYRFGGEGPALLLLHGIAGSSRAWTAVLSDLARDFTVVAPDLLGHGNSAKPATDYSLGAYASGLRDFLEVIGIDRATVIGQSFGGGVAMQLAYQYPDRCERLVLVDSGGLGREVSFFLRFFTLPGTEYLMPALFPGFVAHAGNAVSGFLERFGIRSPRIAEKWRAYVSLTDPANRTAFVRILKAVIEPGGQSVSALDRLYLAADLPTLIMWGSEDDIIPVSHAHAAHQAMPESRLEIIEGVGHFPHAECPDRFVAVLRDFIATTKPSAASTKELRRRLVKRAAMG